MHYGTITRTETYNLGYTTSIVYSVFDHALLQLSYAPYTYTASILSE